MQKLRDIARKHLYTFGLAVIVLVSVIMPISGGGTGDGASAAASHVLNIPSV